jgi:hypothetical protein
MISFQQLRGIDERIPAARNAGEAGAIFERSATHARIDIYE